MKASYTLLILLASLSTIAYSDCVIMSTNTGAPANATGDDAIPKDYSQTWTGGVACPEFMGKPSCCNDYFNNPTVNDFEKLKTAFGNSGGGCDLCAANVMRFFCYYACSPNQTDFMHLNTYKDVTVINDTTNEPVTINVADINITYNSNDACSFFESCSKITFLTEISAGSSALGFITFQFDRGISTSFSQVHVNLVNDGGLKFETPPHRCNETYPSGYDQYGFPVPGNCSCNFCSDSCAPVIEVPYGSIQDGLNTSHILLAYLFAILLTATTAFIKKWKRQSTMLSENTDVQRNLLEESLGAERAA